MAIAYAGGKYVDATFDVSSKAGFVAGDSGSTYQATVPAGESWEILGVVATITTNATVGNRTHVFRVKDGAGSVYYQTAAAANLAASQTAAVRSFLIGNSGLLASNVFAPAGAVVDVFDSAAIAAGDTISVKLMVRKHYEAQ